MTTIPLYNYESEYQGDISEDYALRLEKRGEAKLLRQKRGLSAGRIRRVILHKRACDPRPRGLREYMGKSYSHRQPLGDGHKPWALKPLGRSISSDDSPEYHLAPEESRATFLRVVMDCVVTA